MSTLENRFDAENNASFFAGEIIAVELQLRDGAGAVQPIGNRRFAFTLHMPDRTVVVSRTGVAALDEENQAYVGWALGGIDSAGLYPSPGLRYEIAELFVGGRDVLVEGAMRIRRAPGFIDPLPGQLLEGGPVTRFIVTRSATGARLIVSQRGAPGRDALADPGDLRLIFENGLI